MSFVRLVTLLVFVGCSGRCWSQTVPDLPDRYRADAAGARAQPVFDPLGVRLGSFLAHADGDVEIGYNSNLFGRSTDVLADRFVRISPSLRVKSDWGRHSIEVSGGADLTRYASLASQDSTDYRAHAAGLIEIGDRLAIRPTLDYSRGAEPRGTAGNRLTVGDPVYGRRLSTTLAGRLEGGLFSTELVLAYRRESYEPVRIDDALVSLRSRDSRGIGGRLTLLHRYSSAISALVQVVADDTRNPHPEFCCSRNSSGYAMLGGVRFDNSGLVAGQFAVGYRHRSFAAGGSSQGVTYDARIQWYPTALVTVGFTADQQYRNSGITAANAVLVNKQSVTVAYEMYRDLNFTLQAGREASHYREVDVNTLLESISLRATYTSRRLLQLTAFAQYAVSDTSRPSLASGYNTKRLGLTVRVRI